MKTLITLFITVIFVTILSSCKKDAITPGNYNTTTPPTDTSNWQTQYGNGGVLPSGTPPSNTGLTGTTWVLTKMVSFATTTYPNDTIRFVSNGNYTINGGAVRRYTLTSGVASTNKTLTFNYFTPFGGSHYSGEVGYYFISDGVINQCEFMNIQNSTDKIKAWFTKI